MNMSAPATGIHLMASLLLVCTMSAVYSGSTSQTPEYERQRDLLEHMQLAQQQQQQQQVAPYQSPVFPLQQVQQQQHQQQYRPHQQQQQRQRYQLQQPLTQDAIVTASDDSHELTEKSLQGDPSQQRQQDPEAEQPGFSSSPPSRQQQPVAQATALSSNNNTYGHELKFQPPQGQAEITLPSPTRQPIAHKEGYDDQPTQEEPDRPLQPQPHPSYQPQEHISSPHRHASERPRPQADPSRVVTARPSDEAASATNMSAACYSPPPAGECRGAFIRYYYDRALDQCDCYLFGGCTEQEPSQGVILHSLHQCLEQCQPGNLTPAPNCRGTLKPTKLFPQASKDTHTLEGY